MELAAGESVDALRRRRPSPKVQPGTHDATVYGTSRASPHCFYAHHVAAISSAIVHANALILLNAAASMSFKLSVGLPATA